MKRRDFLIATSLLGTQNAMGAWGPGSPKGGQGQNSALIRQRTPMNRTKILLIYNTNAAAVTSDGYTSEQCADWYALNRGFTPDGVNGHYYKLGFDFGGKSIGQQSSFQIATSLGNANPSIGPTGIGSWPVVDNLVCAKSYAPGQSPALNNARYTGVSLLQAIVNMIDDNAIQAVFVESLVPNLLYGAFGRYGTGNPFVGQPTECYIALAPQLLPQDPTTRFPNGASVLYKYSSSGSPLVPNMPSPLIGKWRAANVGIGLPYGRTGYPGCSFARIQTLVADANWAEQQNNLSKLHVIGSPGYTEGGDTAHLVLANALFANTIPKNALGYFDTGAAFFGDVALSYTDWVNGVIFPSVAPFGLLYSNNPSINNLPGGYAPVRGAWAFNWCSNTMIVAYQALIAGAVAAITDEDEPFTVGLPSVDCVAQVLLDGFTMCEANYLSTSQSAYRQSVYGVPDYAPYALTNTAIATEGS